MSVRRALAVSGVVLLVGTGAAACSSSSTTAPSPAASVSAAPGSAADVAFAQAMIPHHEQAVEMANLALDPKAKASPEVKAFAEQIKVAQAPEIELMTEWLSGWGAPTAMPGMDHSGHDMGGMAMTGMMSSADMKDLEQSSGKSFDKKWLTMMIAHHEGAIQMAQEVKAMSDNPQVETLADQIIVAQKTEIDEMNQALAAV